MVARPKIEVNEVAELELRLELLIQFLPVFFQSFAVTIILLVPKKLFEVALGENAARVVILLLRARADWLRGL